MNQQAGRSGRPWQRVRLAVLRANLVHNGGRCTLCGSERCPKCGRLECDGSPRPGQVDHIVSPLIDKTIAEQPANLRAAHGCCNRARSTNATTSSRRW